MSKPLYSSGIDPRAVVSTVAYQFECNRSVDDPAIKVMTISPCLVLVVIIFMMSLMMSLVVLDEATLGGDNSTVVGGSPR